MLGGAVEDAILPGRSTVLPVRATAVRVARDYLRENFHDARLAHDSGFSVPEDCMVDTRMGRGSEDLIRNYQRNARICPSHEASRPANDTSPGVGYAPLTDTDLLTHGMERFINRKVKDTHGLDATGKDVKVMAARSGEDIHLTIARAMMAYRVSSVSEYRGVVEHLRELCEQRAHEIVGREVKVAINRADDRNSSDLDDHYLTVTGLSMEIGDDGSVGRGNRVNGLITPYRPMSTEAAAGKSPVTHIGKLYNVLAGRIASRISDEAGDEVQEVQVRLLSQMGSPIDLPVIASVELIFHEDNAYRRWSRRAVEIADSSLACIEDLTEEIVKGSISIF